MIFSYFFEFLLFFIWNFRLLEGRLLFFFKVLISTPEFFSGALLCYFKIVDFGGTGGLAFNICKEGPEL